MALRTDRCDHGVVSYENEKKSRNMQQEIEYFISVSDINLLVQHRAKALVTITMHQNFIPIKNSMAQKYFCEKVLRNISMGLRCIIFLLEFFSGSRPE